MNRLQRWVAERILGLKATAGTADLKSPRLAEWLGGGATYAGKTITEQTAMQVTTAFSCVRVLAEAIGSLSWDMYERQANGDLVKVDHPLSEVLLGAPNEDMTEVELREAMTTNLASNGNFYAHRNVNASGRLTSLYPIPSPLVRPKQGDDGVIYYEVNDRGKWDRLPREKVWHVKGFGTSGLVGLSPIGYARQTFGVALATEEFQARFFSQGANPSWIVSLPEWLEETEREIARENLQQLWTGLENAHRVALLEGGMKAESATMPLNDAQFLELRKLSRDEICGLFRVAPHLVANLERSTNNNIEHQSLEFVMFTLAPYLVRIQSSAKRWLLSPGDRGRFELRFNVESLLRASATTRADLHSKYVQNGIMSRNEVRVIERLPKSTDAGMDSFTAQVNLTPVGDLGTVGAPAATPSSPSKRAPDAVSAALDTIDAIIAGIGAPVQAKAASGNEVNINLPASLKHELSQRVELGGVDRLIAQVVKAQDRQTAALDLARADTKAVVAALERLAAQNITSMAALAAAFDANTAAQLKDKEFTLDADGNPTGVRIKSQH